MAGRTDSASRLVRAPAAAIYRAFLDPDALIAWLPPTGMRGELLAFEPRAGVGHSTGGGEVTRYVAQAERGRVARAVLIAAIPPVMVKSETNPGGTPIELFDGLRAAFAANRAQFYRDLAAGPFYGFNRPGVVVSQGLIDNWWRQGMMGGSKAQYDCIAVFSETDFTEDLKRIDVPVLVMHGDDDQVVPYADSAPLSSKLLKNGILKTYAGFPHGMAAVQADIVNRDILAFIRDEVIGDEAEKVAEAELA